MHCICMLDMKPALAPVESPSSPILHPSTSLLSHELGHCLFNILYQHRWLFYGACGYPCEYPLEEASLALHLWVQDQYVGYLTYRLHKSYTLDFA